MLENVKLQVKPEEIIEAVKGMKKAGNPSGGWVGEAFLEDLLAATSKDYLKSIKEARDDYKAKRVKTHKEVFGK